MRSSNRVVTFTRKRKGSMLTITREAKKSVKHPQTGEKKTRVAVVTFNAVDPGDESAFEDALDICGGNSELLFRIFNYGLWRKIQQDQTNELGKTDEISKAVGLFIKATKTAFPDWSDEKIRTTIMANPEFAAKVKDAKFIERVEVTVENGAYLAKNEDGTVLVDFPDVVKSESADTDDEAESDSDDEAA